MIILGLRHGHDASAALIVDGNVVADVAEERFTRIKCDGSFPVRAVEYCLKTAGITSLDIDVVALPSLTIYPAFFVFFKVPRGSLPQEGGAGRRILSGFVEKMKGERGDRFCEPYSGSNVPVLPIYQEPWTLSESCRVVPVEHHLAHAASACYSSGRNEGRALVVTMDGSGDDVSVALWRFEDRSITPLKRFGREASMGWFYANATEAMGWRHGSDEWKVMGLAPYGVPREGSLRGYYPEFEGGEIVRPHDYSAFGRWNDHGANHYHGEDAQPMNEIFRRSKPEDFAAEVQRVSEEQAFRIVTPWLKKEKTRHLICAGGFFHNIKLNQRLWYSGELDSLWIYPNAGDSGLPFGAAMHVHHGRAPRAEVSRLGGLYYGPEYSDDQIREILEDRSIAYEYVEDPAAPAARYLSKNLVLGWFQGRMETGPRALGNRSILMSPLRAENKDIINHKIKYREAFRPFAPAMLHERAGDYIEHLRDEHYMICSFDVKPEKRQSIPAVVHQDATARPQMVKKEHNELFHRLIEEFGRLTGEYVVMNTSFNVKGEPVVCHPREALKCFYDTGMDVLILGRYVIKKHDVRG